MNGKKVVIVTGAAGNLGRAVAAAFAARGAALALFDRDVDLVRRLYGADDAGRMALGVDLVSSKPTADAVKQVLARWQRVDVLCNIAGGFAMGDGVHEASDDLWRHMIEINVATLVNTVRAVAPAMIAAKRGKIVNIGANAAISGKAGMGAYVAAKSAVIRLTESLALELRESGINVNCVLPSILDTPENRKSMPKQDPAKWVTPAALADVIAFLASDGARAVHGAAIPVVGLS